MLSKYVVFLLINLVLVNSSQTHESAFLYHQVVHDVLSKPPDSELKVTFPSGAQVQLGNKLSIAAVAGTPVLHWDYHPDRYYTVVFCDADPPSRTNPEARSFLHWLVVNVPGRDVAAGDTLTALLSSRPEPATGLHRYILLVYLQPGRIQFQENADDSFERRKGFSPETFANKYKFGNAIAGNFYQTENLDEE